MVCRECRRSPQLGSALRRVFLPPRAFLVALPADLSEPSPMLAFFVGVELAPDVGPPRLMQPRPPTSERAGRYASVVEHIPAGVVGRPSIGRETVQHAVRLDPLGDRKT